VTIGNELRQARVRLGLSCDQISRTTKIQPRKIIALEENAFDQLPTGIYLDGIVAAYAREVGCDGEGLVRRLRSEVAPPLPETLEEIVAVRQSPERSPWELSLSPAHLMSAFAGVVVVLAIAGLGVHFYPWQPRAEPQRTAAALRIDRVAPVAQRSPLPPSFSAELGTSGSAEGARSQPDVRAEFPLVDEPPPPPAPQLLPIEEHAPLLAATEPAPVVPGASLEGTWALATEIESSSLRRFEGLRLEYRVELRQNGGRVEGTGRKISENGVSLRGRRQTPIAVHGTIDGGRLKLTFGEQGARRSSQGTFDLVVEHAGVLRGSFASEAARSTGVVEARRL
jgi:cytoskeleton protein RodZ